MIAKKIIKKEIDKLPQNLVAEVYDFILFLESRNKKGLLAKTAQSLSESSFKKVWDNEEDAVYDSL